MLPGRAGLPWGAFEVSWKDATRVGGGWEALEPQALGSILSWQSMLLNKSKDKVHLDLIP